MPSSVLLSDPPEATEFLDVIYERRAVRSYTPRAVEDAVIQRLLDAAVHAPTAMHQEPWRFVIVQNREVLRELSDRAKESARIEAAHHGRLLKRPGAAGDGITSPLADPDFNIFYDAGTLVIIGADPVNEFVAADCWLAAENLMLAAAATGLGTCCIGFAIPALNTPEVKATLGIPPEVRAFVPIIVGEPRGETLPVPRRPAAVVSWIR